MEDAYVILGIDRLATDRQIRTAYKKKMLALHPDKYPEDPNNELRKRDLY
jgi:curved DNA-binding protein CbpA